MSVYSNNQIREAIKTGHIVCTPFDEKHVSHASLDVTLGHYFYRVEQHDRLFYNPFDEQGVQAFFGEVQQAIPHAEWCKEQGVELMKNIPADHPVIPLAPGERILAHTHEFFGIKAPGAYQLSARSSWARNGLTVTLDAGWVEPGYCNRLTMQIYNMNRTSTLLLPVGERVAQAVFFKTGEVEGSYGQGRDGRFSGKYQQEEDLQDVIKNWSPDQMLPRAFKDARRMPEPIKGLKAL